MQTKPILVVMAAGMGSRYGGLKQIDPVGPSGEAILDYSLYDARRAGFKTVVFIIKHEIEQAFKEAVGARAVRAGFEVRYAYQQLEKLPEGFTVPEGRVKPWGTAHAILVAEEAIGDAPFAVINADDYYGPQGFKLILAEFSYAGPALYSGKKTLLIIITKCGDRQAEHLRNLSNRVHRNLHKKIHKYILQTS